MKTFSRVMCSIAAVLLGLGLLLAVAGLVMGASFQNLDRYYEGSVFRRHLGVNELWGSDTIEQDFSAVTSLEVDLNAADVRLVEGDAFSVKAENVRADRLSVRVDQGVLRVVSQARVINWQGGSSRTPRVTITFPKGFVADSADLSVGMGSFTGSGLSALRSSLSVGMGEMTLTSFTSGPCRLDVGMGTLTVSGVITGSSTADCSMGSIKLSLAGDPAQYGYSATVGMGRVKFDGDTTSELKDGAEKNSEAPNFFIIDCGMGEVLVSIAPPVTTGGNFRGA